MNDRLAIGALAYLREQKILVPEDVAIVVFDNLDISPWYDPPPTTVDQVVPNIFREAVARHIQLVQQPAELGQEVNWILLVLIVRKTT
jgi:DNA-binding LacI/PurR family transcriptional regulator